jgi:hypothetical protein
VKLVIGRNRRQAEHWLRTHGLSRRRKGADGRPEAMVVTDPRYLEGLRLMPNDEVVRVGTYYERRDLGQIDDLLARAKAKTPAR